LLTAALVAMMGALNAQTEIKMRRDTLTLHTAGGAHRIDIEVAESDREKAYGLMFRQSLGDSEGMLFPYPTAHEITMWMRNTFISLDMIFIRADGIVHRIETDTEPHSERIVASEGDVTGVLEMKAGSARRLGLNVGDRVEYKHFKGGAKH
jgi:uncharacterized membrane protein (UPF0127 family)